MINLLRSKNESLEYTIPAFHVLSRKKKEKHGKHSVKVHNGKYSTKYMDSIWKLQYEFADSRLNCFTG